MKFTTKLKRFFKNKKVLVGIGALVIISMFLFGRGNGNGEELFTLTSDSLATTGVTVGGTVIAQQEVNLSFAMSGRVASVSKKAGDKVSQGQVLASLDTGTISANLLKAQADLDAEIARLNEYKNQEGNGLTEVQSRKSQLVRELKNAYTVADDAIRVKTDQFFLDADKRFPQIYNLFKNESLRVQVNEKRYEAGLVLAQLKNTVNSVDENSYTDSVALTTKNQVTQIQAYLTLLSTAVNNFTSDESNSQATIDRYKSDTSAARSSLNSALNAIIAAEESVRSTTSQIPYQEARVKSARAVVQGYQAEIGKGVIRAPFAGLVTRQDAKVGTSAMSDQELVALISDSNYGIETYVPEVYISQISAGNKAKVILNSYGATQIFEATVSHIDPAASQRNGVASYKVNLTFDTNDERIKSGMSADVEIMTETVNPAFWVPASAVVDQGGATYVKVKSGAVTELRKVEAGERRESEVEIKSGLIVGDQIILNAQQK